MGAEQIILLGRHPDRIALARAFGATDVVSERGEEAVARVRELTGGFGAHAILNAWALIKRCTLRSVSHEPAARSAASASRTTTPSRRSQPAFYSNISVGGGPAPVRAYIEELLPDVLDGRIKPGRVFDSVVGLDGVPEGYRAMNERKSIKVMVKP